MWSMQALQVILTVYSEVSGYKVNEDKSVILGQNISEEGRIEVSNKTQARWC